MHHHDDVLTKEMTVVLIAILILITAEDLLQE
jgi:hypothetical protein